MDLTGTYLIPASREKVWDGLNDPAILKQCIPGCEMLDKVSDTEFNGLVVMKVGVVKARLKGSIKLSDIDAPNGYAISGQGQGGVAGFAKGGAVVTLTQADDGGTALRYQATAELGGKLAAVGSRVIQGIAKKMADDFFGKFAAQLSGKESAVDASTATETPATSETAPSAPAPEDAAIAMRRRDLSGTARDLIWYFLGIATGFLATLAYVS